MKRIKIITIIFLSLIFLNLSKGKVSAQNIHLTIWPPLLEVTMQPGKSITQVYKLANKGDTNLVMTSSLHSFSPADEFGNIKLTDKQSEASDWISFQNADLDLGQSFNLPVGKEQEVVLKIKTPSYAREKDYYFTLIFSTNPAAYKSFQPQSEAQAKIGANILITVSESGEPQRKAEIVEFSLKNGFLPQGSKWQIIDSFTQPEFILRIKNNGQSLFKPMGSISINWLGRKYILDLLPENILVDSIRQAGCQKAEEEGGFLCQLNSKFNIGYYKAKVEFDLDKVGDQYQRELYFFAIPLKAIFIIIILIIISFFIFKNRQDSLLTNCLKKIKNRLRKN